METTVHLQMKRITLLVIALVAMTACGGGDPAPGAGGEDPPVAGSTTGSLAGREFWSTSIAENGQPKDLVEGTRIRLRFDDGNLGATAGCNSMGGAYSLDGQATAGAPLLVSGLGGTDMGCEQIRHEQDDWLTAFLLSSPELRLDGDQLILANDTTTIELLDREIADPDRRLDGTEWVVTGFVDGDTATNISVPTPATMTFDAANNLVSGTDGCNDYAGPVEIADGSIGGPVEGDGEIQFGPIEGEQELCEGYEQYQPRFHAVFESGQASYVIEGPNLTITTREGSGLTLRAADA